jgi:uroporphyrinogen-III synthase
LSRILILRPEPGASSTAGRARLLGLDPLAAPLFTIRPLAWERPQGSFDAVLLTSANAARNGGPALAPYLSLPCHAVGEATAEAAREAGFAAVASGPSDGAAALDRMADSGVKRALHPCGREHVPLSHPEVLLERRIVYAADAVDTLPPAAEDALACGALVLLHSPRAAALFAHLCERRGSVRVAAISAAAAAAAGRGWAELRIAAQPRDQALLELAAELCNTKC